MGIVQVFFRRRGYGDEYLILASLNNKPFSQGYIVWHPEIQVKGWREIFNSDSDRYGGNNVGNFGQVLLSQPVTRRDLLPLGGTNGHVAS